MNPVHKRKRRNGENSWQWRLTFIGQRMGHNYYLYYVLDQVFARVPGIRSVIEIGTGHGAMTTVLGLWGIKLGIPVWSFDHKVLCDRKIFNALNVQFCKTDEFSRVAISIVDDAARLGPVFLICDGGDKVREFALWVPRLSPGSIIGVHDWGVEIGPEDVAGIVSKYDLAAFLPQSWERMNVQFAMWRKW